MAHCLQPSVEPHRYQRHRCAHSDPGEQDEVIGCEEGKFQVTVKKRSGAGLQWAGNLRGW